MAVLLLALALLAILAFGIGWFLRANPSSLAKGLRRVLIVAGVFGLGGILLFSVRLLPELLPGLLGLAGVAVIGLLTRWLRQHLSGGGGFSTPDGKQRTEVRTAFLRAWIDHATGDVGGAVMAGRFAGRTLDSLSDAELIDLHGESAADGDSARVLEAYLDRRLGPNWRTPQSPPPRPRGDMSREEALSRSGPGRERHGGRNPRRPSSPDPARSSRRRRQRRPGRANQPRQGRAAWHMMGI